MRQGRIRCVSSRRVVQTALLTSFLVVFAAFWGTTQQTPAAQPTPSSQSFPLADIAGLSVTGGKAEPAEYLGRKAVRLTSTSEDSDIFAYINGSGIQDGVIEVDLAVKITTPPGVRMPGFTGIAFRARSDGSHYDMFYLRPR